MILDIILCVLLLSLLGVVIWAWQRVKRLQTELNRSTDQLTTLVEILDPSPEEVSDFDEVKNAFSAYINRESSILQHADFGEGGHPDYIGYESGYTRETWYHEIWIAAWLPPNRSGIAAIIAGRSDSNYFESHYRKFEANKDRIQQTFSFEEMRFTEITTLCLHSLSGYLVIRI